MGKAVLFIMKAIAILAMYLQKKMSEQAEKAPIFLPARSFFSVGTWFMSRIVRGMPGGLLFGEGAEGAGGVLIHMIALGVRGEAA